MDPSPGATRLGMEGGSEGIAGTIMGMGGGLEGMLSAMAGKGLGLLGSTEIPFRSGARAGGALVKVFLVPSSVRGAVTGVLAGSCGEAIGGSDSKDVSSCNKKRTRETIEAAVMKNMTTRFRVRMNQSLLWTKLISGKKVVKSVIMTMEFGGHAGLSQGLRP